ncbi:MAG: hypothetical protein LBG59_00620 [Candidatus Peribacteria bacterium]|jgi:hypothetical protein|nr:hypothetical protein [Candidatus Peribacteria bacterium]
MQQYIELLQGYYKFLSLGKFFENQAQTTPLFLSHHLPIATGDHTKFSINAELTSSLLTEIHKHPHSKNVFGYLVEISAFRGIFSVMREMIENLPRFRNALKAIFADQYLPFEQTIRFLRNVLSHSSTPSLLIQQEDFQKQKEFLASQKVKEIRLHFLYHTHLPEWEGSPEYVCEAIINFSSLHAGTSLRKVVTLHQMYMLSELCYNITKVITKRSKHAHPPQTNPTPPKHTQKKKSLHHSK